MPIAPKQITAFTFFKLPAVFWLGIRVKTITKENCTVSVKHQWINQNPFKSLFWAVILQGKIDIFSKKSCFGRLPIPHFNDFGRLSTS